MSVYVDAIQVYPSEAIKDAQTRRNGNQWSHMWADDIDELHEMADRIGLKREWFQDHNRLPHYDVTPGKRQQALRNGAQEHSLRDWLKAMI